MTTVAVSLVKDELDILPFTLAHMLEQCDAIIVADNMSRDGTRELLHGWMDGRLTVIDDLEPAYLQSEKMSALAERARGMGATWVLPWDSDEAWFARSGRRIADVLAGLPRDVLIVEADLWDHVPTSLDPDDANPLTRIGWRRSYPGPLPKVAVRAVDGVVIEQGNHGAWFPHTDLPAKVSNLLTLRHYALRSPEQMIRKARNGGAAYAATTLPEHVGAHWRRWSMLSDEQLREVFERYYFAADPEAGPMPLTFDPAPVRCPLPS
jgi:hypothetical protein